MILSTKYPKARKTHKCNYCGLDIEKGEVYQKDAMISGDSGFYQWKSHVKCHELARHLKMFENYDDGVTDSDFQEEISENFRDLFPNDINTKEWRDMMTKIKDYYFECKGCSKPKEMSESRCALCGMFE